MTVAIIGHRRIDKSPQLIDRITDVVSSLIADENVDTFLFGSRSEFDDLCYDVVTNLKNKYPHINRVYVMAEYANGGEQYRKYILTFYEDCFYDERLRKAGALSYVERNRIMIDRCDYLLTYYDADYKPPNTNSGTKTAVNYAISKKKSIFNVFLQ